MNDQPQTFDLIIKAVADQSDSVRPNHLYFLWFRQQQDTISLVGSSSMEWRLVTFKEMHEFGDHVIELWDVLLMWSKEGPNDTQVDGLKIFQVINSNDC